jgi:hypothetical protein
MEYLPIEKLSASILVRTSGVLVVDNVACKAVERGERCNPREVSHHTGVGLHRLYRCKVAPLRVDDYVTLIRGGDEAGRDPAIEPADDGFSIVTQEFDELLLILRLNGQDVDKGRDFFRHRNCCVHGVLRKNVALRAYTMKTIPAIKTNRSDKKNGTELGRHLQ